MLLVFLSHKKAIYSLYRTSTPLFALNWLTELGLKLLKLKNIQLEVINGYEGVRTKQDIMRCSSEKPLWTRFASVFVAIIGLFSATREKPTLT